MYPITITDELNVSHTICYADTNWKEPHHKREIYYITSTFNVYDCALQYSVQYHPTFNQSEHEKKQIQNRLLKIKTRKELALFVKKYSECFSSNLSKKHLLETYNLI